MRLALVTVVVCGLVGAGPAGEKATEAPTSSAQSQTLEVAEGLSIDVARVPAGKFTMGSPKNEKCHSKVESPMREVTITRDFLMSKCEITRAQFAAFVKAAGYKTDAEKDGIGFAWDGKKWDKVKGISWQDIGYRQSDNHPVVGLTYNDAVAFCKWVSTRTGRTARLPTEAEWEYAARAGTQTVFAFGATLADAKGAANIADKTALTRFKKWKHFPVEDGYVFTSPVGSFKPNAFGLYDMHGNVWEWCSDWWARDYSKAATVDPQGPKSGRKRVIRGGSWMSSPPFARVAHRRDCPPKGRGCDNIVGIRLVVEVPETARSKKPPQP